MLRVDQPVDARVGKRAAQRRRGRNRVDDVAERAEPDDQDIRLDPRIRATADRASSGPWDRRRSRCGRRSRATARARARCRRCSRCPCSARRLQQQQQRRRRSARERSRRSRRRAARRPARRDPRPAGSDGPAPSAPHRRVVVDRDDQAIGFARPRPAGSARGRRAADRSSRWRTRSSARRARSRRDRVDAARSREITTHRQLSRSMRRRPRRRSSSALTVAVPRFITTRPPA